MRNHKNNITSGLENIISFSRNITSHFTGKAKIITLAFLIIMLSFVNVTLYSFGVFYDTNVSALSYSSNVGIGFTFNPTLSVSISPSNLVIDNLTPSITADSNAITVSVATNAAYGYTLSAMVNNNNGNSGNGSNNNNSNSNLTHTNGTSVFSSIATDASLSSLTNDNTWGYSYRLSNNSNSSAWSNYSGLSNETSKTLINTDSQAAKPIDFKIAAKASDTQPSGVYTGTINFAAVTNVAPMSLLDSFIASGAEQLNGYYKMQDMTHSICSNVDIEESELQLIDVRDNKIYWVAKLKDGNCWMTQNLDLDLDSSRTYTHYDTDLGWNDPDNLDTNAVWKPDRSTIDFTIGSTISGWQSNNTTPYSANPGEVYLYTSNSDANDIQYNSLQECIDTRYNDCVHYHAGNYYNWSAAVASNNTNSITSKDAPNSICPKGWRLPITQSVAYEFGNLLYTYNITKNIVGHPVQYQNNGQNFIRKTPLWFVRSGNINGVLQGIGSTSFYQSSTPNGSSYARFLYFSYNEIFPQNYNYRSRGMSIRCVTRQTS